ncbi:synaptic vesicular amine transporter, putative [Pediculus humanus corporis]|uniref:Synaptic vesicular amine transporter, putative n=1 Tax=Pediculus humanus subsp. corporis TaxID=121224 RepID=E0VZJ0_PEDHC|nr:synaptic vesicular amine transporter, putative [Pediculus humanus corporis]EEB18796.1 synaptic vesicular amine transporter, putative [Pediculus humanus corporis]
MLAGVSVIAFGLLGYIETHGWFISLSFLFRIFEALGSAAAVTAAFAITAAAFPENVATTFAALEIFYGVGYIAGPSIGGILYSFGGYVPPFLVMGTALLLDGLVVYFVLPSYKRNDVKPKAGFKEIFKVPAVLLDALSVMSASSVLGFYSATLEPHIREFELSPITLGLMFVINGAFYAASAPFVGMLCDRKVNPKLLILAGSAFMVFSVLLVGPAPFIPIEKTLGLVIAGLVLEGFGMSCIVVSAFIDSLRSSVAGGFPDDIATYGLMSGLWASSFSLGDFVGPSVAGFLTDWFGFRYGSLFIIAVHGILMLLMIKVLLSQRKSKTCSITKDEMTTTTAITTTTTASASVAVPPPTVKEEHVNPCIVLEENCLKTNGNTGTGYGSIETKQEYEVSRM